MVPKAIVQHVAQEMLYVFVVTTWIMLDIAGWEKVG